MKIREAKVHDQEKVMQLLQQLHHPLGINSELFISAFNEVLKEEKHIILVAEDNKGKVCGYVSGHIHTSLYALHTAIRNKLLNW